MYVIWNQRRNFPRGRGYRAFAFRWIDMPNVVDKRKRCKEINTNGGKREDRRIEEIQLCIEEL